MSSLHQMKTNTINYIKHNKVAQENKETQLKEELQALITEDIDDENLEQILSTQHQIQELETKRLFGILSKKKTTHYWRMNAQQKHS